MLFQRANDTTGGAIFQFWFLKYFGNMFSYANIMKGNNGMVNFVKVNFISTLELFIPFSHFYAQNNHRIFTIVTGTFRKSKPNKQ